MTLSESLSLQQLYITHEPLINSSCDAIELLELIYSMPVEEIFAIIKENQDSLRPVTAANIPQFSNEDDVFSVLRVLIDSDMDDLDYEKLGYYMRPRGTKHGALVKYGENHYKFAEQLGLVTPSHPFSVTDLGLAFYLEESSTKRHELIKKLVLRIPLLQHSLLLAENKLVDMTDLMAEHLAISTVKRRGSNVRKLLGFIMDNANVELQHTLNNLVWS